MSKGVATQTNAAHSTLRVRPTLRVAPTPRGPQTSRSIVTVRTEVYLPLRQDAPPLDPDRVVEVIIVD